MERIGLNELTGGALQEKFQCAMDTVLRNMQDPNTPWKNNGSQIRGQMSFMPDPAKGSEL